MAEADDFLAESETLYAVVAPLPDEALQRVTQFKDWTIEEVLIHLHFWDMAVARAAFDPDAFKATMVETATALSRGKFRDVENAAIEARGSELVDAWIAGARRLAADWAKLDPAARVPWVGPSMSARTAISARQMETWAHGFEVFDVLGLERREGDRIRNIVMLGANTFGWSHKVHKLDIPKAMPELVLTLPSGGEMRLGDPMAGRITGEAVDFAAVVTQTRALEDTGLEVEGGIAWTWMENAQCFAGKPNRPPEPGTRYRKV